MALRFAPKMGTIVTVDFDQGFRPPEMVKRRLAVVISPIIKARGDLVTVVPLSTTAPTLIMPYHCEINIPFVLPAFWGNRPRWVKADMVNAVGFHRVDLLHLGKDASGKRLYQTEVLPSEILSRIRLCVLRGLGYEP
jgi:mRNA interferase MazF